jgi:hypothetical protein
MADSWQRLILLLVLCICTSGADSVTGPGKPLSIRPSQFWYEDQGALWSPLMPHRDGNDGPWSTFRIGVGGSSTQPLRVLPASGQSSSLLVLPEACAYAVVEAGKECSEQSGGVYMRNASRTWVEYGQYKVDTYLESRVGVGGDGLFGFDDISLGWTGDGLPTVNNQSIAGVISPEFTLGSLALNARPVNFTNYNDPVPSLLQNLRKMPTPIPSLSWSYTAGAYNLAPKVFGSLVLGGYDSARFEPNSLTFPFGADVSLDLQVAIQRIAVSGSNNALMSKPIISYISTLVPDIWLPSEACTDFLTAFSLSFNSTSNYFYVNNTMHKSNLANNPIVSFQVGPEASGSSTTIRLPYWNFYLATQNANSGTFRFPIRLASNDSQYILGRTFLQSAYLSVDYERNTFNLSQALYPSSAAKENVVSILPPNLAIQGTETSSTRVALSTGAIVGIAIAGAAFLLVAVVLLLLYRRNKKAKATKANDTDDTELQGIVAHEMAADEKTYEMQHGGGLKHELAGDMDPKIELSACMEQEKPAEAAESRVEVYELPADEKWVEMEGEGHFGEHG